MICIARLYVTLSMGKVRRIISQVMAIGLLALKT
jgi:hypothetical protein